MLADVCVNTVYKANTDWFTYRLPAELVQVKAGWRVIVPFGQRTAEGFVWQLRADDGGVYKNVSGTPDEEAWFTEEMMATAWWMSRHYIARLAACLALFIPGKTGVSIQYRYHAQSEEAVGELTAAEQRLYGWLTDKADGALLSEILERFGEAGRALVRKLVEVGAAVRQSEALRRNRERFETVYEPVATNLSATMKITSRQQELLQWLATHGPMVQRVLGEQGFSADLVKRAFEKGLLQKGQRRVWRDSYGELSSSSTQKHTLTDGQQRVFDSLRAALTDGQLAVPFLLYGVTGSGKTEIYMETAALVLQQNKQVLIMIPEIGLTGQLVARFQARFQEKVAVLHSRLSLAERYDTWERVRHNDVDIVIGPRSAVFAPFQRLGLVVLDEEHEASYRQEEMPGYHAREVAIARAKTQQALVVLGSATPDMDSYQRAKAGDYHLLKLPERIDGAELATVTAVDMRAELAQGNRSVFSTALREALENTLKKREQAIILLNRRGYSTFVMCRDCGYVVQCPHCSVSMVYHRPQQILKCHYCDYTQPAPDICPTCRSRRIRYFGTGTQKAVEELGELFPEARILRMDQDTTGGKFGHDKLLGAFRRHEYDILLGTQMVAKGHDFSSVTLAAILTADSLLHLPDFRSAERTFSLITQTAGRSGRGERRGRVIVQSYMPEHPAIVAACRQDYEGFFEAEITLRRALFYPPFATLFLITCQHREEAAAQSLALEWRQKLEGQAKTTEGRNEVFGPLPSAIARMNDVYYYIVLLKTDRPDEWREWLRESGLLAAADVRLDVNPFRLF